MIEAHLKISSIRGKARAGVAEAKGFGAEERLYLYCAKAALAKLTISVLLSSG